MENQEMKGWQPEYMRGEASPGWQPEHMREQTESARYLFGDPAPVDLELISLQEHTLIAEGE